MPTSPIIREALPFTQIIERGRSAPVQGCCVEFRLIYQGILRSNGGVEDKFSIRRQFHTQLRYLWAEHPLLKHMCYVQGRWAQEAGNDPVQAGIRKLADTHLNGFSFLPLSREEWHLRCSLDMLFLRREKPGKVFMHGDIDNRLKTLFDALQMPRSGQEVGNEAARSDEDPFYVLLEGDELIADVSVTTDRLLTFPEEHQFTGDYAVLVINVKLQPLEPGLWSHVFN